MLRVVAGAGELKLAQVDGRRRLGGGRRVHRCRNMCCTVAISQVWTEIMHVSIGTNTDVLGVRTTRVFLVVGIDIRHPCSVHRYHSPIAPGDAGPVRHLAGRETTIQGVSRLPYRCIKPFLTTAGNTAFPKEGQSAATVPAITATLTRTRGMMLRAARGRSGTTSWNVQEGVSQRRRRV